ncbi:Crp/Fnr family transcriptional regulator [Parasporobacterium paucivorans]|uniref:CRP/FNR family transcriptional regulator, anaerobic regulatory protein n=1 Tax=Parasporobacterium paucivorans DSM 15970 TaxID=1122934 RepID=A0A1M6L8Q5_9FIRM|nr:Crp/Fnr family transcriptional regulator [Parasporobacterium paucivorans]SHJ67469.1 CRP/FNR family transcriptional regulator, anaerobic regulatory protein [Parasporobacterium paucivorans DSM 15970]
MLDKNELTYVATHFDFWDKLNPLEKNIFENNIVKVKYNKGFNLHSSDSECLGVLLIKSGGLRVYILSEDGREVTLYRLSPNDVCVLSASCILNNITFDVHIDAESDTEAYLLNIGAFSRLHSQNVYVENFAYKNTIERFSDVMWAFEQILFLSFDKRLAIFLLDELNKSDSDEITLTQDQIAKYIGSAREVVSRMLKAFQNQGILEQSRGSIRITDKNKLKHLI